MIISNALLNLDYLVYDSEAKWVRNWTRLLEKQMLIVPLSLGSYKTSKRPGTDFIKLRGNNIKQYLAMSV